MSARSRLGLPGTMPVLNKRAIGYAMRVAKALNCTIIPESEFSRKNYFYPDLDKAYQITQYDKPLAAGGTWRSRETTGRNAEIQLTRIHVEEDPFFVHMGNAELAGIPRGLQPFRDSAHRNRI